MCFCATWRAWGRGEKPPQLCHGEGLSRVRKAVHPPTPHPRPAGTCGGRCENLGLSGRASRPEDGPSCCTQRLALGFLSVPNTPEGITGSLALGTLGEGSELRTT